VEPLIAPHEDLVLGSQRCRVRALRRIPRPLVERQVDHLEREDEVADVAKSLEGKALLASKSPWITVLAGAVGFLIANHILHLGYWGMGLVTIVSALFGGYIVRVSTRAPISGIIRPGSV